ncbi:MAG: hypothetical protein IT370_36490 [Deltaproteobacteria bacterium]|jgi:hypothetical protein|nr:hypothetical protein [Deltaproteobacteria bacterium]
MQLESFERRVLMPIRFGEFLVERRVLAEGELLDALADHWQTGVRIGDVIAGRGFAERAAIEACAREYHGELPVVEVEA